jgi:hypothetical protein
MKLSARLLCVCLAIASVSFGQLREKDYRKADSVALLYTGHSLQNLHELTFKLTTPFSTDEEKFRAIYRWICENIDNDYSLYLKNKNKREKLKDPEQLAEWNRSFLKEVFRTMLTQKRTVCTGYAYLVKQMAAYINLPCEIVDGYGRTTESNISGSGSPNHSWVAIKLNGSWYLCDPTWSAGSVEASERKFIRQFDDSYFLAEPELFLRKHYPLDTAWILSAHKLSLREFLDGPIIYSGAFQYGLNPVQPATLNVNIERKKPIRFKFTKYGHASIDKVEFVLKRSRALPKKLQTYTDPDGHFSFGYTFQYKGTYTIHILLNGSYAFTYVIDVK